MSFSAADDLHMLHVVLGNELSSRVRQFAGRGHQQRQLQTVRSGLHRHTESQSIRTAVDQHRGHRLSAAPRRIGLDQRVARSDKRRRHSTQAALLGGEVLRQAERSVITILTGELTGHRRGRVAVMIDLHFAGRVCGLSRRARHDRKHRCHKHRRQDRCEGTPATPLRVSSQGYVSPCSAPFGS